MLKKRMIMMKFLVHHVSLISAVLINISFLEWNFHIVPVLLFAVKSCNCDYNLDSIYQSQITLCESY